MNILFLINCVDNFSNYLLCLESKMKDEGHNVVTVSDSFFTNEYLKIDTNTTCFEDYFRANFNKLGDSILEKYSDYPLNEALLSDYERAYVYSFHRKRDNEYYRQLKISLLHYFEGQIKTNDIDMVHYENISNTFSYYAWIVADKHGIPYLGVTSSRLPGYFTVDSYIDYEKDKLNRKFKEIKDLSLDEIKRRYTPEYKYLVDYIEKIDQIVPDGIRLGSHSNLSLINKYFKPAKFKKLLLSTKYIFRNNKYSFQQGSPLRLMFFSGLRATGRKLKAKLLSKKYTTHNINDKFILYPLHFHPESSTSVRASTYLSELEVIRNIAFNLPEGYVLYVKDHPSSYGYPSLEFYSQLKSYPNIKLISPFENTKKLIKYSEAVITLTSTVGYEALILNKRVYLIGDIFYSSHKNVINVENMKNVGEVISSTICDELELSFDYKIKFLLSYLLTNHKGLLNFKGDNQSLMEFSALAYHAIFKEYKNYNCYL